MDQLSRLSNREQDVVKLLLEGMSNKLIAASLHITENTVEFHLKNIYAKFQVSSRTELIIKLGNSVVADQAENAENRDTPTVSKWSAALRAAVSKIGKELKMENLSSANAGSAAGPMTFQEAIRVCFIKYADFHGRASRAEFWWFMLFIVLAASALTYIHQVAGEVFMVATLLPLLAAGTRRLRDSGKSGWWQLFLLAPVGGIVILGFMWALPPASQQPGEPTPA